jgi:hypothetical protein
MATKKKQQSDETPAPTLRDEELEEETTKRTEDQASDPAFTGGDKPKEVKK